MRRFEGGIGKRVRRFLCLLGLTVGVWTACCGLGPDAFSEELRVDFGAETGGVIRLLHGVNGGVLTTGKTVDLTACWREAKIPLTRLHDCEFPRPDLVDLHAVFPDALADPESPASYQFARTDDYLAAIRNTGAGVVYRLGESIEHSRRKYYVHPPVDYAKWAGACVGIIRHYNEGWANGFQYGIRYWEIWNEPENRPAMWSGSDADYNRLYATAARAIKARFPELKVGGPSVGATGELAGDRLVATPFLEGFLRTCREEKVPLDFFSWHTYTDDPFLYGRKTRAIRAWLDANGFRNTEIHLNEWNYLPGNDWGPMLSVGEGERRRQWYEEQGSATGAAFVTCALLDLQDSPLDVSNFYSGDTNQFGLFDRYGAPKKTYYAFKAFSRLIETPVRVGTSGSRTGQSAVCAGVNRERREGTILVSRYRACEPNFDLTVNRVPWSGETVCRIFKLDARSSLECVEEKRFPAGSTVRLPCDMASPGVLMVRVSCN
jgi:hypothetical protein